jgi:hypothetical protein
VIKDFGKLIYGDFRGTVWKHKKRLSIFIFYVLCFIK